MGAVERSMMGAVEGSSNGGSKAKQEAENDGSASISRKGKGKVRKGDISWSRFFGEGLGSGARGYSG